jgi:predicted  nucleic acid-binding Zn-ribbon protein
MERLSQMEMISRRKHVIDFLNDLSLLSRSTPDEYRKRNLLYYEINKLSQEIGEFENLIKSKRKRINELTLELEELKNMVRDRVMD